MPRARRFSPDVRERAVRMVGLQPCSRASRRISTIRRIDNLTAGARVCSEESETPKENSPVDVIQRGSAQAVSDISETPVRLRVKRLSEIKRNGCPTWGEIRTNPRPDNERRGAPKADRARGEGAAPREANLAEGVGGARPPTELMVAFIHLLQGGRPSAGGLGQRESWRGCDQGWCIVCCGLGLTPYPARTVGVPAVVPLFGLEFHNPTSLSISASDRQ